MSNEAWVVTGFDEDGNEAFKCAFDSERDADDMVTMGEEDLPSLEWQVECIDFGQKAAWKRLEELKESEECNEYAFCNCGWEVSH
jgi:hypothetical protein